MIIVEPVRLSVVVHLSPARAFDRFALDLAAWWPREYTWSQDVLQDIGMDPRVGGLCFEIGPHDFRCDWGRLLAWDPPYHLTIAWQISPRREPVPNPAHASTVAVTFAERDSDQTTVSLVHDDFARHGDRASDYRESMAASEGWQLILQRYVDAAI